MREHPDHHDAELLLRLYELRREEKLRQAREWLIREFQAESFEDLLARYPRGSAEHVLFRMATSYWEMAASLVNFGLIKEDLFFENTNEIWLVWQRVKPLAAAARKAYQNPEMWKNLEAVGEKFEKWMAQRAPGALEALRKIVLEGAQKKK